MAEGSVLVKELMDTNVVSAAPNMTIKEAASLMAKEWHGSLPVVENSQFIGVLTARAIVTEAVAKDRVVTVMKVRELMTPAIVYCFDDQPVEAAVKLMEEQRFRHLFIVDRDKRLAGVLSLVDVARRKLVDQFHDAEKRKVFPDVFTGTDAS